MVRVVLLLVNTCPQKGSAQEIILDGSLCFGWRKSDFLRKCNSMIATPRDPNRSIVPEHAYAGFAKHLKISTLS